MRSLGRRWSRRLRVSSSLAGYPRTLVPEAKARYPNNKTSNPPPKTVTKCLCPTFTPTPNPNPSPTPKQNQQNPTTSQNAKPTNLDKAP